jgi:hypothetical protein
MFAFRDDHSLNHADLAIQCVKALNKRFGFGVKHGVRYGPTAIALPDDFPETLANLPAIVTGKDLQKPTAFQGEVNDSDEDDTDSTSGEKLTRQQQMDVVYSYALKQEKWFQNHKRSLDALRNRLTAVENNVKEFMGNVAKSNAFAPPNEGDNTNEEDSGAVDLAKWVRN